MFIPAQDCHHRSAIKAVSWRALGSLDTFVLSYFITGSFVFAGSIASAETVTKVVLYYLHERAWSSLSWGRNSSSHVASLPLWTRLSRTWVNLIKRSVALALAVFRPREFAATAALLVCFAVVVSPPQFRRSQYAPTVRKLDARHSSAGRLPRAKRCLPSYARQFSSANAVL